jgi:peptidoglycan/LPS O-acetylase OafA/YrhL
LSPVRKFDSIQILRALAALMVLVHHTVAIEHRYTTFHFIDFFGPNGRYGVDLFFAISGFIITYTALHRIRRGGAWLDFVRQRLVRIYPVHWQFSLAVLAIYLIKPEWVYASHAVKPDLVGSFLLTVPEERLLNGLGWTLTFELYFYLAFSAVFFMGRKGLPLLWIFWGVLVTAACVSLSAWMEKNFFLHVAASPLVLEFILGSMVGYWALSHRPNAKLAAPALALAAAYLIIAYGHLPVSDPLYVTDAARTLLCAIPAALIVFAAANAEAFFEREVWSPLVLIGNASYSLYLSHVLVISGLARLSASFLPKLNAWGFGAWLIAAWAMATGVGIANYLLVEKPLLRILRRKPAPV